MSGDPDAAFRGALVQKVDVREGAVLLKTRTPGQSVWWLLRAGAGREGGLGAMLERPSLPPASEAAQRLQAHLRRRLEGARLLLVGRQDLLFEQEGEALALTLPGPAAAPRLGPPSASLLRALEGPRDAGVDAAATADPGGLPRGLRPPEPEPWLEAGQRLLDGLGGGLLRLQVERLLQALARTERTLQRRAGAVEADLQRCLEASNLAAQAGAFTAEASRVPRGARSMTVTDWSTGEPQSLTLALDPARSAREQLEALFHRARRLKKGAEVARARLEETRAVVSALGELQARARSLRDGQSPPPPSPPSPEAREQSEVSAPEQGVAALEALLQEARRLAPRDFSMQAAEGGSPSRRTSRPGEAEERLPYRLFLGQHDRRILVGRGAKDNDALTARFARPQDLWLHAKGVSGAHVVVPLDRGESCPPELLVEAAHLAAHFSDQRGEPLVEVQYTAKRHLRRPKGSAPGAVNLGSEKVLLLRLEPERLKRLLAAEQA